LGFQKTAWKRYKLKDDIYDFAMGASETYAAIGVLLCLLGIVIVLVVARACRCISNLGRSTDDNDDSHEDSQTRTKPLPVTLALMNATAATMQPIMMGASPTDNSNLCMTCTLIRMGSATTYSDGSCPSCGNYPHGI